MSPLQVGFSTFFMNRCNRSGVINGGIIGGAEQTGKWRIDARFTKATLLDRIQHIARHRSRITVTCLDAEIFLGQLTGDRVFAYIDPPYFQKGRTLYRDWYDPEDHARLSALVARLTIPWIVTYDRCDAIESLYKPAQSVDYGIRYSAADRYEGAEVLFA